MGIEPVLSVIIKCAIALRERRRKPFPKYDPDLLKTYLSNTQIYCDICLIRSVTEIIFLNFCFFRLLRRFLEKMA